MFAPAIAFVDLETTGTTAAADRVTEVGIVRVVDDGAQVSEWSSLLNPECSIAPAIQALTGITNAMVAHAPTFREIAGEIAARLAGCVFVAHNARFDYGFLKHEFARLSRSFTAKVLCTVKLSRRLYPGQGCHNLDAVMQRHGLATAERHRALGDARILWQFVQSVYRDKPLEEIDAAVRRILKIPSLPPQLAPDALDQIPEAPGVYLFYGLNALPLYIGKSVNLRERVASHFSSDYRSASDLRLSTEITRIEIEQTAGELGALLRESQLIKTLLPAHNRCLRRRRDMVALSLAENAAAPDYVTSTAIDPSDFAGLYGPYASRAKARATLHAVAREARLCWSTLRLDRREGPCFARQLGRCSGACVGVETPAAHAARLRASLSAHALQPWPYPGTIAVREADVLSGRTDVHVFRNWCWLGSASDDAELQSIVESPPRAEFDLDIYRLLVKRMPRLRAIHLGT